MRAFVAVPLCDAAKAMLGPLQEAIAQGRPVADENLHLTLAFLDDQPEDVLEALHDALLDVSLPRFEITFGGLEAQGGKRPALIWAKVPKTEGLQRLQGQVRAAAHRAGIALPRVRFRPHVTLVRFSRSRAPDMARLAATLAEHGAFRAGPFCVERFCLYASTLTPEGPVYDVMAEYGLDGGRP